MKPYDDQELTDPELDQLLATWTIAVPSARLRARIFADRRVTAIWHPSLLASAKAKENWFEFLGRKRSFGAAMLLQGCVIALLSFTLSAPLVHKTRQTVAALWFAPYHSQRAVSAAKGGGGGGGHARTPVSRGAAPQLARKNFIPPAMAVPKPLLPVTPTISAPAPQIEADVYGDPLSKLDANSPGQGVNGLGDGKDGGLGTGGGDGYGPGYGNSTYRIGGDVSRPILISKVEPEYSEQARKAKYSGSVLLSVVVDEHGIPRDIKVVRPLGLGLDQKAVEAVQHWRFRPGLRNGKPVRVWAVVEVSFRLL